MGLKGLQITGNSIMPMLTYYGNPLVEHFPTHAEQFNQNVNGLSWGSANLAWQFVELFKHYMSVALIFAVQALDLRATQLHGHYDGRHAGHPAVVPLYEAVCDSAGSTVRMSPLMFNDADQSLEDSTCWLSESMTATDHRGSSGTRSSIAGRIRLGSDVVRSSTVVMPILNDLRLIIVHTATRLVSDVIKVP